MSDCTHDHPIAVRRLVELTVENDALKAELARRDAAYVHLQDQLDAAHRNDVRETIRLLGRTVYQLTRLCADQRKALRLAAHNLREGFAWDEECDRVIGGLL